MYLQCKICTGFRRHGIGTKSGTKPEYDRSECFKSFCGRAAQTGLGPVLAYGCWTVALYGGWQVAAYVRPYIGKNPTPIPLVEIIATFSILKQHQ